ncbi:NAD-dependent epimerase/dehydratase family protein [Clostridium estertheticum]|uniref:NAD-dependent epimerase/dehydratase family protein n=1 Tax=Clostridium estertheticum TaxID=238834 RepID=A0AA47EMP9_9CLOT|nr:NAD-dependent epimerase/dehydratase family protein [Clostridium estertheticum]MBU3157579.1 NAD-dependent epimerase/dehydratase family protein [Clostridium estertheticum]MBU3200855.1 NAD-dependent epimerase/dehydratase family protein [Clostridium estertheticum]WAG61836.1 NAD-dependent epimerase/dehydratase family protein [Clostridium estertheticum]WAG64043.1 NAD-dependent epimerase/dehydratase family protein [Clostridium estertheticum]
MEKKTALVVGATGLVGGNLVNMLLEAPEYEKIIVWVRKSTGINNKKLEEKIINFELLDTYKLEDTVNHIFCCLGTTIKKAKSKEAFKKVDLEYIVSLAMKAKENDVSQFLVISAMGSDVKSAVFYNKVKGQMENELSNLVLRGLKIFRPSLLLGDRTEFRFGEKAAEVVSKCIPFIFNGALKKYKPVYGNTVAKAMYKVAIEEKSGIEAFNSEVIQIKGTI